MEGRKMAGDRYTARWLLGGVFRRCQAPMSILSTGRVWGLVKKGSEGDRMMAEREFGDWKEREGATAGMDGHHQDFLCGLCHVAGTAVLPCFSLRFLPSYRRGNLAAL